MARKLQFLALGGADEVGRSCFLLGDGEKWVMLDCGLSAEDRSAPDFELLRGIKDRLVAVLISHAHADHVGGLPALFAWMKENGWTRLPLVLSTPLTKAISGVLLRNVLESAGDRGSNYGPQDLNGLFSDEVWETMCYDEPSKRRVREVVNGVLVHFINANHAPGSASIVVNWEGFTVLYTGDCCHFRTRLPGELANWSTYSPAVVITESTYGQETHLDPDEDEVLNAEDKLIRAIKETLKGGGRVLIPVFPFSRAEEIMLTVAEAFRKGRFPHVKCYSVGPQNRLINAELDAVTKGPGAEDQMAREYAEKLTLVRDVFSQVLFVPGEAQVGANQEFFELCSDPSPSVIIAAGGAVYGNTASAILASKVLDEHGSRILIAACWDEDSPARRLLDDVDELREAARALGKGEEQLRLAAIQVRFRSHILPKALVGALKRVGPRAVILVHGTSEGGIHLENLLTQNAIKVLRARNFQMIRIDCGTCGVEAEPLEKPAEGAPEVPAEEALPPIETWHEVFVAVKRWLSDASGVAAVRVSEVGAPKFGLNESLRGTARPGYYHEGEIWVNPELRPEALKPLLAHAAVHYLMDALGTLPKREPQSFQDRAFAEGAAEYIAFQLTGMALTDCAEVGDDGEVHPAERNPYSEGFRKFSIIERRYGKGRVAELITTGSTEAFGKESAEATTVTTVPPQEVPELPPAAPPRELRKPLLRQARGLRLGKAQRMAIFVGIAVVVLALFLFSDIFIPRVAEQQVFSIEGVSNPLSPGEYSFNVIAHVSGAPMLVESTFVFDANYSFSGADVVEMIIEGSKLPRGGLQPSVENYDGDNDTEFVVRGNWEFFEDGNVTIPVRLRISGGFDAVNLLVYSKVLPRPTVEITFEASGIDPGAEYSEVLRVDDVAFLLGDLPKTFSWEFGSVHTYSWTEAVASEYATRFALRGVSGLATEGNATFNVPSVGGKITASYGKQFLITTTVHGEGSINIPPESWHDAGELLNLTATATPTSIFKYWTVDGERFDDNPAQVTVNQSRRIECYFNRLYNIEFDCNFKQKALTPILIVENSTYFPDELPQTFTREEGAYLNFEWLSPVQLQVNNTRTIWLSTTGPVYSQSGSLYVSWNATVFANYGIEYLVQVSASDGGSVSPKAGAYWCRDREVLFLYAYPLAGYEFECWMVNGVNLGNGTSLSVTVTEPLDITAVFRKTEGA